MLPDNYKFDNFFLVFIVLKTVAAIGKLLSGNGSNAIVFIKILMKANEICWKAI